MYKVNGELSSCDITYSGRVPSREGDKHNFAQSLLFNGLSKSDQTFTVGFVKVLSSHPIHIVVWGNFPFKHFEIYWYFNCQCLNNCYVFQILKAQVSPSRMALSDLNPNLNAPTDETTHIEL